MTTDKWAARTVVTECEFTDEELDMLKRRAAERGLTLEEYLRTCMGFEA